jgi:hypothetical protein
MDWSFGGAWPYEPCWFDSQDGRMHYLQEDAHERIVPALLDFLS